MSKHTPGPWFVDPNYPSDVLSEIGPAVVIQESSIDLDSERVLVDARLISAAPELLAVLKRYMAADERKVAEGGRVSQRLFDARKAVQKAMNGGDHE